MPLYQKMEQTWGEFKSRWITEWLEVLTWIRPWSLSFTIRIQKMVLGHFFLWKIPEKESHVYFFFLDASITILTLIQSTKWQKLDICTQGLGHEQTSSLGQTFITRTCYRFEYFLFQMKRHRRRANFSKSLSINYSLKFHGDNRR